MDLIVYLVLLAVGGLVVGGLARLALPGRDPMSLFQTLLIGIAGSVLAGLVSMAVIGRGGGGILLSVLFATAIVYVVRRSRGGGIASPGRPRPRV